MTAELTPNHSLGGEAGIGQLVQRFYELMDELPEAHGARQLHPETLSGSAEKLFDFLSGWFGGLFLYIEKKASQTADAPRALGSDVSDA